MASGKGRLLNETHTSSYLSENEVLGAALNGRDPVVLTVPQLKRWLQYVVMPPQREKSRSCCTVSLKKKIYIYSIAS